MTDIFSQNPFMAEISAKLKSSGFFLKMIMPTDIPLTMTITEI